MKKIIYRLLAILLAVLTSIITAFQPLTVKAEQETVEIGTVEYFNPRYYPELKGIEPQAGLNAETVDYGKIIPSWVITEIRSQFKQRNTEFTITLPYSNDVLGASRYMFITAVETHTGKPDEGDYMAWQYGSMRCRISSDYSTVNFTYMVTYYTTRSQETAVTNAVSTLKKNFRIDTKSNYLIIKTVYDWIADHIEYSEDMSDVIIHTAYGAVINRDAVCQGYAVLFYRMMLEYGIDCRVITSDDHAWNIVKLGNKYYDIDVTWASTTSNHQKYFLRGSINFTDHPSEPQYLTAEFRKKYPIDTNDYEPGEADLDPRDHFSDVRDANAYYFAPVYWAVDHNITVGYGGNNKFSPNAACTREQIVTFLWRLMGEPEPSEYLEFTDVSETDWFYKPVSWAAEKGITVGLNDGTGRFGVNMPCTREMCVTFLHRAAGRPEVTEYIPFTDVEEGRYFFDAVSWAAEKRITVGLNDGTGRFGVGQKCTRAMIVTFLYRYAFSLSTDADDMH